MEVFRVGKSTPLTLTGPRLCRKARIWHHVMHYMDYMTTTFNRQRRIRLRDLETLAAVVQSGSMRKAAESVHLSQPAVSRAIRDLEHALGVRLLQRGPGGTEPTAFAESVLRRSRVVFDELQNCLRELAEMAEPGTGHVLLGCGETLHAGLIPSTIATLLRAHPRMQFTLESGQAPDLIDVFLRGRLIDFVVARPAWPLPPGFAGEPLFRERMLVAVSTRHPLARKRKLGLADLVDEHWILSRSETDADSPLVLACAQAGLELPARRVESGSLGSRYVLLESGRFVTLIPHSLRLFSQQRDALRVLPIELPVWSTPVMIITVRDRVLSPAAELFLSHLRDSVRRHKLA